MSYSSHSFIGRLTADPKVRDVKINGEDVKVANMTVAVDDDSSSGQTDFIDVVAWRGRAVNAEKFLSKGRLVLVEGRPKKRSYQTEKDGVQFTQYTQEVVAKTIQFLDKPASEKQPQTSQGSPFADDGVDITDDETPF